jgi:hypothetical protein
MQQNYGDLVQKFVQLKMTAHNNQQHGLQLKMNLHTLLTTFCEDLAPELKHFGVP